MLITDCSVIWPQHGGDPTLFEKWVGPFKSPDRTSRVLTSLSSDDVRKKVPQSSTPWPERDWIGGTSWLEVRDLTNCPNLAHSNSKTQKPNTWFRKWVFKIFKFVSLFINTSRLSRTDKLLELTNRTGPVLMTMECRNCHDLVFGST